MALVTVQRSPTPSATSSPCASVSVSARGESARTHHIGSGPRLYACARLIGEDPPLFPPFSSILSPSPFRPLAFPRPALTAAVTANSFNPFFSFTESPTPNIMQKGGVVCYFSANGVCFFKKGFCIFVYKKLPLLNVLNVIIQHSFINAEDIFLL